MFTTSAVTVELAYRCEPALQISTQPVAFSTRTVEERTRRVKPCARGGTAVMAADFANEATAIAVSQLLAQHGFSSADPAAVDLLCEVCERGPAHQLTMFSLYFESTHSCVYSYHEYA